MVNPAEAGIEKTYPLKGNGVMPVVVSIDGQKYASFDVNFDDGSAALTDGYYFDVIETDGEGPDGGESSGESSGSGESSESGESSQPEESESSQEGGDNPLDAPPGGLIGGEYGTGNDSQGIIWILLCLHPGWPDIGMPRKGNFPERGHQPSGRG